ncbi:OprD family outer membrane porin [Sulfurovum sp. zt1-1]|uniref:OprD family outer membrane porin n=1 Tax=Sulfurovum zhangzhouensis TaxID=3019067 RepID=A0ABT7QUS7_9BACT|nr:OprD family outer membrane porin [Sulfurovum zhangzhouensis]MDM5270589.1 OprD family outer membrane porin [Sulfurovum zhangzhouensis]
MKLIKMSLAAALAASIAMAGGNIAPVEEASPAAEAEVDYGTVFGQSRTFYIDRTYKGSIENNRNSLVTGGYIGYKTPEYNGLTAAVVLYGVYGFDIHSTDAEVAGSSSYDPSLYGDGFKNYMYIGEAYLNYKYENTNVKIGRQRLDTPLAGADDARELPNLFEAAIVTNTDIKDTTLIAGHITRESVGTFGNVYPVGSLALQSGYGLGYKLGTNGDFADMGEIALGAGTDTAGVTALAAIYKGIDSVTLQAWDYYAHDILNALYLQADMGWNCMLNDEVKMNASLQYINESDVGDALAGKVDSNYWGAKLGAKYGNFSAYVAYSQTSDSDGAENGGIITPWGGMPAFTQGMVTRHQFFSDTDTYKIAATYNFSDLNVNATVYYASFNVGDSATYAPGLDTTESGFDIIYQATKNLQYRFRGNFPNDFGPTYDWDEYRLIVNYNF